MEKYERYEQLSADTLNKLTSSKENWLSFLDTASRMYKYSFEDQILIHAQRPESRAVADFQFWTATTKMNRHIRKGSSSIALIDRERKKLNYVYAVEDTEDRSNGKSKNPENYIWKIPEKLTDTINASLCRKGKLQSDSLEQTIANMSFSAVMSAVKNYNSEIDAVYHESGSSLSKEEVSENLLQLLSSSATIMAMKRCGFDTTDYEAKQDFSALGKLPKNFTKLLGEITGSAAKTVLRFTESTVHEEIENERRSNNELQRGTVTENQSRERNTVYFGRENTDLSSRLGDERGISNQEMGQGTGGIPENLPQSNIQRTSDAESVERASSQRGRTGNEDNRTDSRSNGESGRSNGGDEGHGYAEMGRSDGELSQLSGGNNQTGTDRSINNAAEVDNTASAVSFADKIRAAFINLDMQYDFDTMKKMHFLYLYENYLIDNHSTDARNIELAFEKDNKLADAFGNVANLRRIFNYELSSVLKSLQMAIDDAFETFPKLVVGDVYKIQNPDELSNEKYRLIEIADVNSDFKISDYSYPIEFNIYSENDNGLLSKSGSGRTISEQEFWYDIDKNDYEYLGTAESLREAFVTENKELIEAIAEHKTIYFDNPAKNSPDNPVSNRRLVYLEKSNEEDTIGHGYAYIADTADSKDKVYVYLAENGDNPFDDAKKLVYDMQREGYVVTAIGEVQHLAADESHQVTDISSVNEQKADIQEKENSIKFYWGSKDSNNEWFTESDALYDIVEQYPEMSFALANAVIEYLDEKQHIERDIPDLNAGWYDKTDFAIEYSFNGETATYDGRYDIGDGKGTGGGTITEHIKQYLDCLVEKNPYHYDEDEHKEVTEFRDFFIPLLEENSKLTTEEQNILLQIKKDYPIRTESISQEETEKALIKEKNAEIADKLAVGDILTFNDKIYTVTKIDGTFMLDMERINEDGSPFSSVGEGGKSYIGQWKNQLLLDAADEAIVHMTADEFRASLDKKNTITELDKSKQYINDYCEKEFGSSADFSDLSKVALAYTTDEENELDIQVNADLENYKILYEYNGISVREEQYNSLEEMNENALSVLDYGELIALSDDEKAIALQKSPETDEKTETYRIYQIKKGDEYYLNRFEALSDNLGKINIDDYNLIYEGDFSQIEGKSLNGKLENLYTKFNIDRPSDFTGHSLSVSDVIVIEQNGKAEAHYVDSIGFSEFPEFYQEKTQKNEIEQPDKELKVGDHIEVDGAQWAVEKADDFMIKLVNLNPDDIKSAMSMTNWKKQLQYTKIDGTGLPQTEKKKTNQYTMSKMKKKIKALDSTENFYDNVREIVGYNEGVVHSDKNIKELQALADAQFEYLKEVEKTQLSLFDVSQAASEQQSGINQLEELRKDILRGSGFENGKQRIYKYYTENQPTRNEFADFLKNEYGTGGHSSTEPIAFVDYDSKGLKFTVQNESNEVFRFKWNEVAKETASLIDNGTYLTEKELEKYNAANIEDNFSDIDTNAIKENLESISSEQSEFVQQVEADVQNITEKAHDFVITEDELSTGGAKTRFRANIDAIKTLKTIEAENRDATPEEQVTLSRYVGWGGLKQAFEDFQTDWQKEYAELKEILTPEEYKSASASVLDAFYTSPKIIGAMYTALENNGFTGGRILEPSMAIGNFFGKMPQEMRDSSSLHGVELDSISGRIAQKLYPSANIQITGFEKTAFKENSFDLAVGNVPFGDISLHEKQYDKHHFKIHDHFFAKALDIVKGNGIVAFITSTGTLDKQNSSVRKYLAERAELVGAIRLPSGAFKASAGTDVDSDIIFLQKRPQPIELTADTMPNWVELGQTADGLPINNYFAENPDMVLGKMVEGNKLFGREGTSCVAIEGANLDELLANAVKNIHFEVSGAKAQNEALDTEEDVKIPLGTRNFSYAVVNDKLYYRNNNDMQLFDGKKNDEKRIRDVLVIRDTMRNLIDAQINDYPEEAIKDLQTQLNLVYDQYVAKHGRIHDKSNQSALSEESSLPLLTSLEKYKGENFEGKAAIFSERTIKAKIEITHVDNANEALVVSLSEKGCVDIDFMQQLTNKDAETLIADLKGSVYENPLKLDENGKPHLETADEYLSGNIRKKLDAMKAQFSDNPRYEHNIEALTDAMPIPLKAGDIDIQLGATWIDPLLIQQFMYENMKTSYSHQESEYDRKFNRNKSSTIRVLYSDATATWNITNKTKDTYNKYAQSKYGTSRVSPYEILEDCLNLKATVIKDKVINNEGKEVYIVNKDETDFAQEKQKELKADFSEWVFASPERCDKLVEQYNVLFNSSRPREYDGSHLTFPEMNAEISLRPHQKDAIAHALYGGNTLFAHEVGAGKTFEMIGSIMEGKRLGLHKKALLCVPNHLTEQIGADFVKLYPNANILVATAKDFEKKNRKKLFAKITTGDYDAVIIGHSQLVKLPMSEDRQAGLIKKEIDELTESVNELKANNGEKFHIAQLERMIKKLQEKLQKLVDAPRRDDEIYFEELGIDKLVLDEAHEFKNLFVATKLSNISGVSTNENVQKTFDLYLKCQYLDKITGSKGIIFSTGTPVSNSISEIHSMMKYLQSDMLRERNMMHFDAWAASFAEIVTDSQLSPEGNKYQQKTRFAHFNNMPELMSMFKDCADIKTTDQLGLDIPECTLEVVVAKPTEIQLEMMRELGERSDRIRSGKVDQSIDNMPLICTDGRKNGLDVRLLNPELPDSEGTKVNLCVNNVFNIWDETAQNRSTQLIFCDMGVPVSEADKKKGVVKFSVYDDIKQKLINKGVPANEIAFIHDAKTEIEKDRLFAKVRSGEVRILIGSTRKMGTGTNVQDLIIASHDLDAPYKPAELEQRRGRMVRQGNKNKHVKLFRYVTEGTFDGYNYQILENKQAFASQIMTSKSAVRSCEDVDDVQMDYATCKALCVQNPLIKERMDLETDVAKLKMLKGKYTNEKHELQTKITKDLPNKIQSLTMRLNELEADKDKVDHLVIPVDEKGNKIFCGIEVNGTVYDDKETGAEALHKAFASAIAKNLSGNTPVGKYKGFEIRASFDALNKVYVATLVGEGKHRTELGVNSGIFTRFDNVLSNFDKKICETKNLIEEQNQQLELTKKELDNPFSREDELQEKSKRLAAVIAELENAQRNEDTNKIENPYLIEVQSQNQIVKLKESGINFELPETKDGKLIVRVESNDASKVKEIIGSAKAQSFTR